MPTASPGSASTSPAARPTCCRATTLVELDAHLAGARAIAAARRRDPLGEGVGLHRRRRRQGIRRSSQSADAGRSSWCAPRSGFSTSSKRCPARPSPSSMASRSAAASSSRSPAAIASASGATNSRSGLPEVMLGIHPGFGGTVRAVRRAGVRTAMEMMLTGKTLRADKALRAGFIDRLVFPADAEAAARELIARQPKQRQPRLLDRVLSWPLVRALVQQAAARAGARQGAPRTLSGALRHHRPVGEARRARRSAPTRPKRARSPSSWSARPRATWCACSCCRIG